MEDISGDLAIYEAPFDQPEGVPEAECERINSKRPYIITLQFYLFAKFLFYVFIFFALHLLFYITLSLLGSFC